MTNPNNNNNNIISLMNVQNLGQMNTNASGASFANSNNMNSQRWEYSNQGTGFSNYNNREMGDYDDDQQEEYEENSDKSDRNGNNPILKQNNTNMILPQQQNVLTSQSHSVRQMTSSTQVNKSVKTAKTTTNASHPNRNNNNDKPTDSHRGEPNIAAAAAVGVRNNKISPLEMICPYCGQFINTKVSFVPTWKTHLASLALCVIGFPCGLCLLPYYC